MNPSFGGIARSSEPLARFLPTHGIRQETASRVKTRISRLKRAADGLGDFGHGELLDFVENEDRAPILVEEREKPQERLARLALLNGLFGIRFDPGNQELGVEAHRRQTLPTMLVRRPNADPVEPALQPPLLLVRGEVA